LIKTPARWALGTEVTPSLTTGTIIQRLNSSGSPEILLCLQPRCDSVRLGSKTAFPFLPFTTQSENADVITRLAAGDLANLSLKRLPRHLKLLEFKPNKVTKTVDSSFNGTTKHFEFEEVQSDPTVEATKWAWLGELRELHAQKFVAQLVEKFNRVGVNGSEWNRTLGGR
jgi:hypothetical protein